MADDPATPDVAALVAAVRFNLDPALADAVERLVAERDALRQWAVQRGHAPDCQWRMSVPYRCTCHLDALLRGKVAP